MELIDDLRRDHDLIEAVAGAFLTFADTMDGHPPAGEDGRRFVRFFVEFAGNYHHAREEETLFPALVERAGLPQEGPVDALTGEHRRLGGLLTAAADSLDRTAIRAYVHGLWRHIDAENSVLLPESEGRLRKQGVRELHGRPMSGAEAAARSDGEALLARYPPQSDDSLLIRGDGCVCCPLMGETCSGLEQSWWSEYEWEELDDHLGGD